MIFYSKETNSFYDSSINDKIPSDVVEIDENLHSQLIIAINTGCIIFENLTYSKPRPSPSCEWIDNQWVENVEVKNRQIISENMAKKNSLLNESNEKIEILQDIIDLDMQENNEDEQLKAWKKYRILLIRIDANNIEITWPTKPQ